MNNDREELVDEMQQAGYYADIDASWAECGVIVRHALDALGADPVRVLRWLEGLPCQTCKEARERAAAMVDDLPALSKETADAISGVLVATSDALGCSACGGSGILGRDGVLRLLGMEPLVDRDEKLSFIQLEGNGFVAVDGGPWQPVFVAVPEPSEGG